MVRRTDVRRGPSAAMSATLKRKTLRALLLPFQVQQDCWHWHEGHAHRFACQERADHPCGEIPLPAGIAHRDVIGAGVESPEAAAGDEPRKPSMRLFGGINTHYSLPSNPTSDRGKRQSAGLRKVSNAVGSRPWPPYSKALPGFPKTGPFHYDSNKFGSSEIALRNGLRLPGALGAKTASPFQPQPVQPFQQRL